MKSVGVAEAKATLSELLGRVVHRRERIIVRRRGKAIAALVPIEDLARVEGEAARGDWLDCLTGLCGDSPELCDALDEIVAARQAEMPRETTFPWDSDDSA